MVLSRLHDIFSPPQPCAAKTSNFVSGPAKALPSPSETPLHEAVSPVVEATVRLNLRQTRGQWERQALLSVPSEWHSSCL